MSALEGPGDPAVSRALRKRAQRSIVYSLLTFAIFLGVLLGILGAAGELDSPSLGHPATIVALVSCVPVLLFIASLVKDIIDANRLQRDVLDDRDAAVYGSEANVIDGVGEAESGNGEGENGIERFLRTADQGLAMDGIMPSCVSPKR